MFYFKRTGEDWNSYLTFVGDVPFRIFALTPSHERLVNFYLSLTMERHSISSIPGQSINPDAIITFIDQGTSICFKYPLHNIR